MKIYDFLKNGLYYIMVKWQIGLECMGEIIGKREMSNACPACPVAKRIRVKCVVASLGLRYDPYLRSLRNGEKLWRKEENN
jgi:hypothetical protein